MFVRKDANGNADGAIGFFELVSTKSGCISGTEMATFGDCDWGVFDLAWYVTRPLATGLTESAGLGRLLAPLLTLLLAHCGKIDHDVWSWCSALANQLFYGVTQDEDSRGEVWDNRPA